MDKPKAGRLFFVKDAFFEDMGEAYLKQNKADTKRPHYYSFLDEDTGLIWAIPCSSRIEKYEAIIRKRIENNRPCNHIQIIKVAGRKEAFLFQDMFPLTEDYIDSIYINQYGPIEIRDPKKIEALEKNARSILRLIRHGVKFTPTQPDVIRIERILLEAREIERKRNRMSEFKEEFLKDSEVRAEYEALKPEIEGIRTRIDANIKQSNIEE